MSWLNLSAWSRHTGQIHNILVLQYSTQTSGSQLPWGTSLFLLLRNFALTFFKAYPACCLDPTQLGVGYHIVDTPGSKSEVIHPFLSWALPVNCCTSPLPRSPRDIRYPLLGTLTSWCRRLTYIFDQFCWIYILTTWMPYKNGNKLLSTVRLREFCTWKNKDNLLKLWWSTDQPIIISNMVSLLHWQSGFQTLHWHSGCQTLCWRSSRASDIHFLWPAITACT